MRKLLLAAMCALLVSFPLFAQETPQEISAETPKESSPEKEFLIYKDMPWALGGNYEFGNNTREGFSTAFGISLDRYLFTPLFALGLRGNFHTNNDTISATEITLNLRAYIPIADNSFINIALFAQFGFGASLFTEEGREKNTYTMDFLAGCRIYIKRTIIRGFYVEPFFRTGFPFMYSGGLAAGHWFNF